MTLLTQIENEVSTAETEAGTCIPLAGQTVRGVAYRMPTAQPHRYGRGAEARPAGPVESLLTERRVRLQETDNY